MNEVSTIAPSTDLAASQSIQDSGSRSLLNFIGQALTDPAVDVQKLEALLRMQREVIADDAKTIFNQAYARLMQVMPRITKKGVVEYPVNKNDPDGPKKKAFNYAKWEDVDAAIRPLLLEHGFSLSFNTSQRQGDGGGLIVMGELLHIAGHSKTASMALPLDTSGGKSSLQGYASSTSFGSRYVAKMLLNLVFEGEDDDGQKGGMSYLSDKQQEELNAVLSQVNMPQNRFEAFLDHLKAGSVAGIEAKDFALALNMVASEKRRQAEARAKGGQP